MYKVTIIIPTYNYASYLPVAVKSIFGGNLPAEDIELLIIDDGSTDNTGEVVKVLKESHTFSYIYQKAAGKAAATLRGILLAKGEFIFTLDADDWFLPGKIETTVQIFKRHPGLTHVASPALIVFADVSRQDEVELPPERIMGKPVPGKDVMKLFLKEKILFGGGSTFACRASVLKSMHFPAEIDMYTDEWLVMNALYAGATYFVPEPLSVWRVHDRNFSIGGSDKKLSIEKQTRLLKSSSALLQAMNTADFPKEWQELYSLKHAIREMVAKEITGSKVFSDRLNFLAQIILSGRFSLRTLVHYHAFNRLIK